MDPESHEGGRAEDGAGAPVAQTDGKNKSELLTILFTDIVGSTQLQQDLGNTESVRLIEIHRSVVGEELRAHEGREIEWAGDSCLAAFSRPSDGVLFALRMLARFRALRAREEPRLPLTGVGLHIGEIIILPGGAGGEDRSGQESLFGLQVSEAARVMSLAAGEQILCTRGVFDNARLMISGTSNDGLDPLCWLNHGFYRLKGSASPLEICEVGEQPHAPRRITRSSAKAQRMENVATEEVLGWRPAQGLTVPHRSNWELDQCIGEGGFGEVWLARHTKASNHRVFKFCFDASRVKGLKREVVLFRLLRETLGTRKDISQIIDWQFEEPPYFIESEYTTCGSFNQWAAERGGIADVPASERLALVAQVADALAAAHRVGVLHKDVKPANVLIEREAGGDSFYAVLTDFGIGLILDRGLLVDHGITMAATLDNLEASRYTGYSGTQMYMAPELIEGRESTTLSDIYSLGVVLYQVAIGDFSRAIAPGWEREIPSAVLREDILACIDGRPENRLDSASELANRLRHLDERERDRLAALGEARDRARLEARAKRTRSLVVTGSIVAAWLLIAISLVGLREFQRAESERALREQAVDARQALQVASDDLAYQKDQLEKTLYLSEIRRAAIHPRQNDLDDAKAALKQAPASLRDWEWGYLVTHAFSEELGVTSSNARRWSDSQTVAQNWSGASGAEVATLSGHVSAVHNIDFDVSLGLVITGASDGKANLWSQESGERLQTYSEEAEVEWSARISPDGTRVLTTRAWDRTTRLWDLRSGEVETVFEGGHLEPIEVARFSPTGRYVATASLDGSTRLWSAGTREVVAVLAGDSGPVTDFQFTDNGSRIVTASTDGAVRTWSVPEGDLLDAVPGPVSEDISVAQMSPTARFVVVTQTSGVSTVWDAGTGATRFTIEDRSGARDFGQFSPDETALALPDKTHGANVWSMSDGTLLAEIGTRYGRLRSLAFSPDGRSIYTGAESGAVKQWVPGTPQDPTLLQGHQDTVYYSEFSRDGRRILTTGYDRSAIVWEAQTHRILARLGGHSDELRLAIFSHSGDRIVTGTWHGEIKYWDGATYEELPVPFPFETSPTVPLGGPRSEFNLVIAGLTRSTISPTDEALLVGRGSGYRVVGLHSGEPIASFDLHTAPPAAYVISPDGERVITSTFAGEVWVWELLTGQPLFQLEGHRGAITVLSFSPDQRTILSSSLDQTARIWDAETGELLHTLSGHESHLTNARFSPDGTLVATGSGDRTVKLWDAASGALMSTLEGFPSTVNQLGFNPQGTRLLAWSLESLSLWDVEGRKMLDLPVQGDDAEDFLTFAAWSPDGTQILACYRSGVVRLWDALSWTELLEHGDPDTPIEDMITAWKTAL